MSSAKSGKRSRLEKSGAQSVYRVKVTRDAQNGLHYDIWKRPCVAREVARGGTPRKLAGYHGKRAGCETKAPPWSS